MRAATLRKAAAIVRERGLAKGVYEDASGRVCAMGALRIAHSGSVQDCPYDDDFWAARTEFRRTVRMPPAMFSDMADGPEDVAAAFEAAAARLEAS